MRTKSLKECYEQISTIIGETVEPFSAVELVEEYRRYWKPDDVKVVLLAESHVFTSESDLRFQLRPREALSGYPRSYAKFVYCLAYGEDSLTEGNLHPGRDGTPQFWKIFYSCANNIESNASFASVMKSKTKDWERIENKINLLKELKRRGVWLVDTSIMALYNDGKKPPFNVMMEAVKSSWVNYTRNVILETDPEHVIVIGKGVARAIESDLNEIMRGNYTVISQPNAHLTAAEHLANYKKYYEICSVF